MYIQTLIAAVVPSYLQISCLTSWSSRWGRCSKTLSERSSEGRRMRAVSSWRVCVNWDTPTATLTQGRTWLSWANDADALKRKRHVCSVYCHYCSYNFLYVSMIVVLSSLEWFILRMPVNQIWRLQREHESKLGSNDVHPLQGKISAMDVQLSSVQCSKSLYHFIILAGL